MAIRTKDEVILDLITNIVRSSEKADILPGQVLRDVVINSNSTEFENLYNQLERVQTAQSIRNANLMTTEELDNLVANFGITRRGATKSFTSVTFYTSVLPNTIVRVPLGTSLGTQIGATATEVTFATRFEITFDPALEGSYFNPETGDYEINADVIADNPGDLGNVGPFTITTIRNADLPFQVKNNNAATGGSDQESNNNLGIRTLNILLGSNVGTETGYLGTALSQDNVLDALVIGPGDDLMTRDGGFGGKVDIWNITSPVGIVELDSSTEPSLLIEDWNFGNQFTQGFRLNFPQLPMSVDAPITITATTGPSGNTTDVLLYESRDVAPSGVIYVNPSGARYHYTVFKADDLETGHSDEANDHIIWNSDEMEFLRTFNPSGSAFTSNTMSVDTTYSVVKTIGDLQAVLDADDKHIITADVLAKEAQKISIDVDMDVVLFEDFKTTDTTEQETVANVQDAIIAEINNTTLGNTVEASDLVQASHNTEGVDNVILNSIRIIRKRSELFDSVEQQITDETSEDNQYFEADDINVRSI